MDVIHGIKSGFLQLTFEAKQGQIASFTSLVEPPITGLVDVKMDVGNLSFEHLW